MSEIKISEMIKKLRAEKGISKETIADVCDVSMQAVSKWENEQSCPDITLLPLLAEYFGVSVDFLFRFQTRIRFVVDDGTFAQQSTMNCTRMH